jgi:hypothetical protein
LRVVAGDRVRLRLEQRDGKVEDHEVVAVADTLDPSDELTAHTFEPGFLRELPHYGFGQQLSGFHAASGN